MPVSSEWQSGEAMSPCLIFSIVASSPSEACRTQLERVPSEIEQPRPSLINWQVLSIGMSWYWFKYTAHARTFGPYCTTALTSGGKLPRLLYRQCGQHTSSTWCSSTVKEILGRSWTCRRSTKSPCLCWISSPHCSQRSGRWMTTLSTFWLSARVSPACPFCPPLLRLLGFLRLWVFRLSPSLEGGL